MSCALLAVAFALLSPAQPVAGASFSDIGGSMFEDDIEWAVLEDIASGCTATRYCPENPVTRGQMAAFIARMFALPATNNDYYSDDDGSTYEVSINRVAKAGIASGCTSTRYCPGRNVTRAEMSTFLARAADLVSGGSNNYFYDDNGTTHEISTNRSAFAGIATGCGEWRFCPTANVTRGQMAKFLHRVVAPVPAPAFPAPPPPTPKPTPAPTPAPGSGCSPSYPSVCIRRRLQILTAPRSHSRNFTVLSPDPHGFDGDHDGVGCET